MSETWLPALNLTLAALGLAWSTRKQLAQGRIWALTMTPWAFSLVYLTIIPLLVDSAYLREVPFNALITVGLLGTIAATWLVDRQDGPAAQLLPVIWLSEVPVARGALLYLLLLAAEPVRIAVEFGPAGLLVRDRLDEYLTSGILQGSGGRELLALPLSVFMFTWIGMQVEQERWGRALAGAAALSFHALLTANTRFPIVMPIAAFVMSWWARKGRPLSLTQWSTIFATTFGGFLLFNAFGNALRAGTISEAGLVSVAATTLVDSQYYGFLHDLVDARLPSDLGRQYWLTPFIAAVPRLLWQGKPMTSTSNILTEQVYGVSVGDGTPITTFTIYGEGYWQLGWLGVFLAPIFFLLAYALIERRFRGIRGGAYPAAMVVMQATTFMRSEIPLVLLLVWWLSYRLLLMISVSEPALPGSALAEARSVAQGR